jgi:hypothetical protein
MPSTIWVHLQRGIIEHPECDERFPQFLYHAFPCIQLRRKRLIHVTLDRSILIRMVDIHHQRIYFTHKPSPLYHLPTQTTMRGIPPPFERKRAVQQHQSTRYVEDRVQKHRYAKSVTSHRTYIAYAGKSESTLEYERPSRYNGSLTIASEQKQNCL